MIGYFIFLLLLLGASLIKNNQRELIFMFIVITIFSSIRYGIGYDYYSYLEESSGIKDNSHHELIPRLIENWSSATFPFLFFILSSIFISFFYYLGIRASDQDFFEETLFYISFPFLFMNQLGVIRQGMATSIIFFAITLNNKKIYLRLALIILAYFCHQSAIIGLLILFPWGKVHKNALWLFLLLGFVSATIVIPLVQSVVGFGALGETGTNKAIAYLSENEQSEGGLIKYLVYIIGLLLLLYYKKLVRINDLNSYYIALIIIGVAFFALFSFNSSLAKRLSMFFFSSSIIMIPQLIKILKIPKLFYVLLCLILFSLTIYVGKNNTRVEDKAGYSVTYPYRTIFEFE